MAMKCKISKIVACITVFVLCVAVSMKNTCFADEVTPVTSEEVIIQRCTLAWNEWIADREQFSSPRELEWGYIECQDTSQIKNWFSNIGKAATDDSYSFDPAWLTDSIYMIAVGAPIFLYDKNDRCLGWYIDDNNRSFIDYEYERIMEETKDKTDTRNKVVRDYAIASHQVEVDEFNMIMNESTIMLFIMTGVLTATTLTEQQISRIGQ